LRVLVEKEEAAADHHNRLIAPGGGRSVSTLCGFIRIFMDGVWLFFRAEACNLVSGFIDSEFVKK